MAPRNTQETQTHTNTPLASALNLVARNPRNTQISGEESEREFRPCRAFLPGIGLIFKFSKNAEEEVSFFTRQTYSHTHNAAGWIFYCERDEIFCFLLFSVFTFCRRCWISKFICKLLKLQWSLSIEWKYRNSHFSVVLHGRTIWHFSCVLKVT